MLTALPDASGTYVMILRNRTPQTIAVGRLGEMTARVGYYLYVGSAFGPGGLRARLAHHLSIATHPHWHIDYLRARTAPAAVWFQQHTSREEHRWTSALTRGRWIEVGHARFGASDCTCHSHLFFSKKLPEVVTFRRRLRTLGIPGSACTWSPAEAA